MHKITKQAREAGFSMPVQVTPRLWADSVQWAREDTKRQRVAGMESDRLWDLLKAAVRACDGRITGDDPVEFVHKRAPRVGTVEQDGEVHVRAVETGRGRQRKLTLDLCD